MLTPEHLTHQRRRIKFAPSTSPLAPLRCRKRTILYCDPNVTAARCRAADHLRTSVDNIMVVEDQVRDLPNLLYPLPNFV